MQFTLPVGRGAIYHLMNRGDRREDIFEDDQDRRRFLETLAKTCEKTRWQVQAYCLMRNHLEEEFGRVETGWCLGDEEFKEELLEHHLVADERRIAVWIRDDFRFVCKQRPDESGQTLYRRRGTMGH